MTSEGRFNHEYVTIASQKRQSVGYSTMLDPLVQENANKECDFSRGPLRVQHNY